MSPSVRFNDDVFKGLNHTLSSLSRCSSNHKSPILFWGTPSLIVVKHNIIYDCLFA